MNKIIIQFSDVNSKLPLIDFDINGESYVALLDTGSESTLFDEKIVESDDYKIEPTDYVMSLIGLSGETGKKRIYSVRASINIKDNYSSGNNEYSQIVTLPIDGIVSDLSQVSDNINERYGKKLNVSLIIGSDTLNKYGAKIDYRRKQLTIKR